MTPEAKDKKRRDMYKINYVVDAIRKAARSKINDNKIRHVYHVLLDYDKYNQ